MFTYFHKSEKYFLSTNPKVLTSTLNTQGDLHRFEGANKYLNNIKSRLGLSHKKHYLLVRDPYSRVESFFKEKLRKCVLQTKSDPPYILKLHQEIFYPYLNIDAIETSLDEKIQIFMDTSFEDYIQLLPKVYRLDQHLLPQSLSYRTKVKGLVRYRFKFDKIIKIEDDLDMQFLSKNLGIDTKVRLNATNDLKSEIVWDAKLRGIVNNLYRDDFNELGYQTLDN